ncbi:MAG: chemotaxis protein MotB [Bacteroidetes bacterium]|nr:MAG: chemotaxis protein MotB [Bacteroidota bacterium]
MMHKRTFLPVMAFTLAVTLFSCVPARKLEEEQAKRASCETELKTTKENASKFETQVNELTKQVADIQKRVTGLQNDTNTYGTTARIKSSQYNDLVKNYEILNSLYKQLRAETENQNSKLVGQLGTTQEELFKKQDELKKKEASLAELQASLEALRLTLQQREARVKELEDILKQKDAAVNELKKKVQDALLGFEGKGLAITQKNGKIYVSMDETLLFASGSTKVQPKGEEALKKLARLFEQNADVNVMVEGHTDDVPMKGSGDIKDNWDLSAMRATSVTKIILGGSTIDPKRITAAGRGEHFPLDPAKTTDARAKNRRTEIILTPKLDELLKVLGSN